MSVTNLPIRDRSRRRYRFKHAQRSLTLLLSAIRVAAGDESASQVTDNLGLIVIGVVAIVAIGGLISGLDKTVFNWVTAQLGLG